MVSNPQPSPPCSLITVRASLSSRSPANFACRRWSEGVHSRNSIRATISGLTQMHFSMSAAVNPSPQRPLWVSGSEAQGRHREVGSGGSVEQRREAMGLANGHFGESMGARGARFPPDGWTNCMAMAEKQVMRLRYILSYASLSSAVCLISGSCPITSPHQDVKRTSTSTLLNMFDAHKKGRSG